MQDIILNGVSITELKKQKELIQKDAAKFISDSTERVKEIVSSIVEEDDSEVAETLAAEAIEILDNIGVVSGVSDVEYYFDYRDEYARCDSEDILSKKLDELFEGKDMSWEDMRKLKVYSLQGHLEEMESTVRAWCASNC